MVGGVVHPLQWQTVGEDRVCTTDSAMVGGVVHPLQWQTIGEDRV